MFTLKYMTKYMFRKFDK